MSDAYVGDERDYSQCSLAELRVVQQHTDAEKYPSRAAAIESEIRKRLCRPPPTLPQFKNRRGGLVFFGLLMVLGGLLYLLSTLVSIVAYIFLARAEMGPAVGTAPRYIQYGLPFNLGWATLLISLGVGSILARRWARALTLILSWCALAMGVLASGFLLVAFPKMSQEFAAIPDADPTITRIATTIVWSFVLFMFTVVPGAFILFYRSKHVKATCERIDIRERWTDRCPLPVLGMVIILYLYAVISLSSLAYGNLFPFFGVLVRGIPSVLMIVAVAFIYIWLAQSSYKQELTAWRNTVLFAIFMGVSAIVTFARIDVVEVIGHIGLSEEDVAAMNATGILEKSVQLPLIAVGNALWIGYLVFVRRYFPAKDTNPSAPASDQQWDSL